MTAPTFSRDFHPPPFKHQLFEQDTEKMILKTCYRLRQKSVTTHPPDQIQPKV